MDELVRRFIIILRGMWAHRWMGLAVAWFVGLAALAALMLTPAKYEATARIFVNTDSILKPLMRDITVQPNDDQRIAMLSRVLLSRPNVEKIVQGAGLDAEAQTREQRDRIVDGAMKTLSIRGAGREHLYTLTFRDVNPTRARQAVEVLAETFIESSKGGKASDNVAARKFIDEQIAIYEKKLSEAEDKLKDFQVRYLGMTPTQRGGDYFARVAETENQLKQARLELREAERARDALRRGVQEAQASDPSGVAGPSAMLTDLEARLEAMRRSLDTLLQRYTDQHPDVVSTRRMVRELEDQRRQLQAAGHKSGPINAAPGGATTMTGPRAVETLRVSLTQAEASVASLTTRVAEYNDRYERLKASAAMMPQVEAEHAHLNRDYEVNKRAYESLVTRRESASMSSEMQTVAGVSDFRMVDPPRVSPTPVWPNRRVLAPLALLLALAAGIAATYVLNGARPTFYDGRALRESTGLPLLGSVSTIVTEHGRNDTRRSLFRFTGGVVALVGAYVVGIVALELALVRLA